MMTENGEPHQQQSLAELCTVCYTDKPKYRCPRCKTQTCSLTCYKRHQQRASCNGQRDPAAFVKRSAWATPAGIDHDYNYLKSVERKVEVASQDVKERGITVRHPTNGRPNGMAPKHVAKAWLPGSALQRYLADNVIYVEKAPSGMSRQRTNRTRTTNKGKVMWTVEWMQSDGCKRVDDESFCESTIGELWDVVEAKRANAEQGKKRKRVAAGAGQSTSKSVKAEYAPERPSRTVPHDSTAMEDVKETRPDGTRQSSPTKNDEPKVKNESTGAEDESTSALITPGASSSTQENQAPVPIRLEDTSDQEEEQPTVDGKIDSTAYQEQKDEKPFEYIKAEEKADSTVANSSHDNGTGTPQNYFYLLKPLTASDRRVLVPIDPTTTLTACLKGRTVLEYPTIYVLPEQPESLPTGYQLEESYTQRIKAEEKEFDVLLHQSKEAVDRAVQPPEAQTKALDANSILDMLSRDLGR